MVSSLRPLLTCALPGLLVLLAGWWYSCRKRSKSHQDRDMKEFQPGEGGGVNSLRQPDEDFSMLESIQGSSKVLKRPEPEGQVTPGWKSGSSAEGSWIELGPGNFVLQQSEQQHLCLEVVPPSGHPGNFEPGEGVCCTSEGPLVHSREGDAAGGDTQDVQEQDQERGGSRKSGMTLPAPVEVVREMENETQWCWQQKQLSQDLVPGLRGCVAGAPCCLQQCLKSAPWWGRIQAAVPLCSRPAPRDTDLVEWEVAVPRHLVGRLIGQKGRAVSFLKRRSGAKIYVFRTSPSRDVQICHIEGSRVQVDRALKLIGEKFADLDLTNQSNALDPALTQPTLAPISWVVLPEGVAIEVIVVKVVSAGHLFIQQHTHPSHHSLRNLEERMYLCYAQRGVPYLHPHIQAGTLCAAPGVEGSWRRAQVSALCDDPTQVEVRYVDYGGYEKVKVDTLRQIRSDFVALPFQGAEVLLENLAPLPTTDSFSTEAALWLEEITRGLTLVAQVTRYHSSGLPLVQIWKIGNQLVSVNRMLADEGFCSWVENA
ncbi:A-kinase anchor protein 1, mitochondrial-like [Brienomyrus brachyistius]|uniref:A-kinase anchor protein 1, mitochondrial-like n=1 Tax=Brienomyrus brachyistius TaxID=42636 RepID=UPI0020B3FCD7|nr:A-kinase anchor protein 1, mitochondrial-like [Brienomyrus brachyistius]